MVSTEFLAPRFSRIKKILEKSKKSIDKPPKLWYNKYNERKKEVVEMLDVELYEEEFEMIQEYLSGAWAE